MATKEAIEKINNFFKKRFNESSNMKIIKRCEEELFAKIQMLKDKKITLEELNFTLNSKEQILVDFKIKAPFELEWKEKDKDKTGMVLKLGYLKNGTEIEYFHFCFDPNEEISIGYVESPFDGTPWRFPNVAQNFLEISSIIKLMADVHEEMKKFVGENLEIEPLLDLKNCSMFQEEIEKITTLYSNIQKYEDSLNLFQRHRIKTSFFKDLEFLLENYERLNEDKKALEKEKIQQNLRTMENYLVELLEFIQERTIQNFKTGHLLIEQRYKDIEKEKMM